MQMKKKKFCEKMPCFVVPLLKKTFQYARIIRQNGNDGSLVLCPVLALYKSWWVVSKLKIGDWDRLEKVWKFFQISSQRARDSIIHNHNSYTWIQS